MKQIIVIAASLLVGFAGGVLGGRVSRSVDQTRPQHVIRARSFELVDETGKAISIWGMNKEGHTLLAFLGSESVPGENGEHSAGLDNLMNLRAALGTQGVLPSLTYTGVDGRDRMILQIGAWEKPVLMMGDERGWRVTLGLQGSDTPSAEDDNWALSFEPDKASIGIFSLKEGGQKYVRGRLSVSQDKVKYP